MKYHELKQAVKDFGFDENVESDTLLVSATNVALAQINDLRRATDSVVFTQKIHHPTDGETEPAHTVGVFGNAEEKTPAVRGGYCWYDIAENIPSFSELSFATTAYGTRFNECRLQGGKIGIPACFIGTIEIVFFRKIVPARLENFKDDGEYYDLYYEDRQETVDVASDREDLLPLLLASLVWADDGQGRKSAWYMQLYDKQVAAYKMQRHNNGQETVIDAKGWI